MKKMLNVLIVLMLMASIAPLTFADEAENSTEELNKDAETRKQGEIRNKRFDGEMYLLQLEKVITKNIIKGKEVFTILKDLEYNTTYLEAILAEFELLKEEVIAADPNATDAVQIFIDLKHDAINLTKDFRETLKEMLDNETIEPLRERIKNMICEQVQNLTKNIQNKIKQFNRNQLHRIYQIIGENGGSFLNKYQNGTLSMEQVKQNISKTVSQMAKERRYDIFYQLKQNQIKSQIKARICIENATEDFQERKQNRLTNRIQKSENMSDDPINEEMQERIRNRLSDNDNAGTGGSANNADNGVSGNGNGSSNSDNGNNSNDNGNKQQSGGGGR